MAMQLVLSYSIVWVVCLLGSLGQQRRIYELLSDGTHAMGSAPYPPTANFKRPFRCCIGLITRLLLITSIPVILLLNHYT